MREPTLLDLFLTVLFVVLMAILGISHPNEPVIFYGTATLAALPAVWLVYKVFLSK
jgi:hypothetical protein